MTVPEGFTVEVVAAEPDLVNPVAMTFDERGRVWVTESVEYPRKSAGPGKDRVKILADSDGDGTFDQVKIFADGLNIPSGIALGYGGVWVANSPDILFYPDADRDDVPDGPPQVVVTGFGRADTHELPNSLTWGPDGYLYGLNGVFNPSKIENKGRTFEFTCAMFRIDPRTHRFSLFCEGTSNPWGIAFNDVGDAFVSACVIDHLWHLVETGYYHRQGGPYPPFTWKLGSIVDYKHQMAAYCGLHWFDSDAYPEQYRKKLFMGNLHGSCINVDRLEKNGATYKGKPEGDFLSANDVWFMPIAQKTGPDGCLYILDWYDRYHCYQDANRDPAGIDRLKGRLYRIRYQNTPRAKPFDLTKETDEQLIERLNSPNIFYRDLAQRLLAERNNPTTRKKLYELVFLQADTPRTLRLHSLWALISSGPIEIQPDCFTRFKIPEPSIAAWLIRSAALGSGLDFDLAPEVALQKIIAARKRHGDRAAEEILKAAQSQNDPLVIQIAWQNLYPLLATQGKSVLAGLPQAVETSTRIGELIPRVVDWYLSQNDQTVQEIGEFLTHLIQIQHDNPDTDFFSQWRFSECMRIIFARIQSGELRGTRESILRRSLEERLATLLTERTSSDIRLQAATILAAWKHPAAIESLRQITLAASEPEDRRLIALDAWGASRDMQLPAVFETLVTTTTSNQRALRRRVFDVLTKYEDAAVATQVLTVYPKLEAELKPAAVELLTSRGVWSHALLDAIAAEKLSKDAVNVTQIAKLLKSNDKQLVERVEKTWGKIRTERNPEREKIVAEMKKLLTGSQGDAVRGQVVYMKLCGQCHKLHGTGQEVGPDITVNGRASFEQLLSNVFDPSLVIGNAYRGRTVVTSDGRVLSGLLIEDNAQRVVLKMQGGKLETIARGDVEEMAISKLSLMPEGVEKQLSPQELIDLFSLLKLDKAPTDPASKTLPNFTELK